MSLVHLAIGLLAEHVEKHRKSHVYHVGLLLSLGLTHLSRHRWFLEIAASMYGVNVSTRSPS